jgi:hypothetical protein
MSSELHWRPVPPPPPDNWLPSGLKLKIRDHLWSGEEYRSDRPFRISSMDRHIMGFLRGLAACNEEGADTLINAIDEHGEIEIWIEG